MSEEKTEEASDKKLEQARERGEVTKSVDCTGAVTLIVSVALLATLNGMLYQQITGVIYLVLDVIRHPIPMAQVLSTLQQIVLRLLPTAALIACSSALVAIVALVPQVGLAFSIEPVIPKAERINPAENFKNIFSMRSLGNFIRSLLKTLIVVVILWRVILQLIPMITQSVYQPLVVIAQVCWAILLRLLAIAGAVLFVIGIVDYRFQKWLFLRRQRMSFTEVKQEYKESEGDPYIKSKRKEFAREIAFSPSLQKAINSANVVVTNPTELAVVIEYQLGEVPRVSAKGADDFAALIRTMARKARVPVVSNPEIARKLYQVKVRHPIPRELFQAVALILQWIDMLHLHQNKGHAQTI